MRKRFSTTRLGVVIACLLSSALVPASAAQADVFNVKAYGAVGDGVQDDTAEFNAAIAAVPAIGGEVYVPAGTYKLSSALTITDKSISFRGEGQRISKLLWTSPSSGLVFSSTGADNKTLSVKSLSFLKGSTTAGTAIAGSWRETPDAHFAQGLTTATISDVFIAQEPYGSAIAWNYGISLNNATAAKVDGFVINGHGSDYMSDAIRFTGKSVATYVSNGDIVGATTGISALDTSEGFHATDVEVIATKYGIVLWSSPGRPGTSVQGCHFNTLLAGIYLINQGDVAVTNNLIYKLGGLDWAGILVVNGDSLRILGNYIVNTGSGGPTNGIVVTGTSPRNSIQANITEGMATGIWLNGAGVTDNVVMGNLNRFYTNASVLGAQGNWVINNP
ncbi:MAG: hypothetical protein KA154_11405 [Gemmatimonadaceae bacterium]|nr:hypothetical protein [Gemmatimonadaceae bacterium]